MSERVQQNQTLPADFAETLRDLRAAKDPRFRATLLVARMNGWTCQAMADALDVSRQAVDQATQRASLQVSGRLPDVPLPPRKPQPEPKAPRRRLLINEELAKELREMQSVAATVNGATPADAPERQVSVKFTATLAALHEQGVSLKHLARVLGVSYNAVASRLARHGYRDPYPSQAEHPYLGRPSERATGAQARCKRGHELSGENLYVIPRTGRRVCRICAKARQRAYLDRKQAEVSR